MRRPPHAGALVIAAVTCPGHVSPILAFRAGASASAGLARLFGGTLALGLARASRA